MPRFLLSAALLWVMSPCLAQATPITYEFQGSVAFVGKMPFGLSVTSGAPVVGEFTYDPASAATNILTDGLGYAQHVTNGFWATIGNVSVSTDEYAIEIANNIPQPGGALSDEFTVAFSSALSPALTSPLVVDGVHHSIGLFALSFSGSSNLYSDASLPSSIQLSDFPTSFNLLSDTPSGIIDVLFNVTTLTRVPEPPSALLLLLGMGVFVYAAPRRVVWRRS
jgi:hypothetical protein